LAPTRPLPTAVIGTGRLARALVPLLGRGGHPVVAVYGRSRRAARVALGERSPAQATTSLRAAVVPARLVLLAVADRAVPLVARRLADLDGIDWRERVVLHHCGALGPEPLAPLAARGAATGLLHPLQSLGLATHAAPLLRGSRARIEGSGHAPRVARALARALGLVPLPLGRLAPDDRVLYHAAAALCSNDVLALLSAGVTLLERIGLDRSQATRALLPLARGTLLQVERAGLAGPLTGPAARGDLITLRAHLRALGRLDPSTRTAHRALSLVLARLARACGEAGADRTLRGLSGPRRRSGV